MARRWQNKAPAFEPWNEADIPTFGGHTGSEMASFQKAAWLGLKAGYPKVIAGLNVFAHHQPDQLQDLHENAAWPFFDTFNFHHYEAFSAYPKLYAAFRAVSAGKPLWVTECSVPVKWAGDDKLKEPTPADLRVQAERLAKVFAHSIHEGSVATFYFMLPHYVEGQTQFGILRPDLTPRPAFLALAAVGRLMADATPAGQWLLTNDSISAFFFKARPDGLDREILVAWSTKGEHRLLLPEAPHASYDLLGRTQQVLREVNLNSAPQFFLYSRGTAARLPRESLQNPPTSPPLPGGEPSSIVFQVVMPPDKVALKQSCYLVEPGKTNMIALQIYNFSSKPVQGRLRVERHGDCQAELPQVVEIAPDEKVQLNLSFSINAATATNIVTLKVLGDFGEAGKPIL
jgi:hypothetical protein